ncbi:MAG TPA: ABC transporter ATP-binding protein [Holophagaceae bacterium]|nr:ABC transporter ATP-binding protein [Holophagaceae bacterium]
MARFAIHAEALTRRHGSVLAVDRVDLRVPEKSIYAFLGANGAGKTTTIRMLLGLLEPQEGTLEVLGRPMPSARRDVLREVGAMVELPSLYPHLTGRENLDITRRLKACASSAVDWALELVGLADAADRRVQGYSLGMRQRLGLALALLGKPRLVILDEPTNGLDPAGIREIRDLLARLPEATGATVFLSSHLLSEVEQLATHLAVLDKGRLRFQGSLEELQLRQRPQLRIETAEAGRAFELLRADGHAPRLVGDGALELDGATAGSAASINARLVIQGVPVHHLSLLRPSLERWFLDEGEVA